MIENIIWMTVFVILIFCVIAVLEVAGFFLNETWYHRRFVFGISGIFGCILALVVLWHALVAVFPYFKWIYR